jgi:2-pyrone-4,6-dicarboxylate lactonase
MRVDVLCSRMPHGAWDTHFHTVRAPGTSHDRPVADALALHAVMGIERGVLVQNRLHGSSDADFLSDLRSVPQWRGVALIDAATSDTRLDALHDAGVRGIRYNFAGFLNRRPEPETFRWGLARAAERGWHVLLHVEPAELLELADIIAACSTPVVIDHCAHLRTARDPGLRTLLELARLTHCWMKLSSLERWAPSGAPHYDEAVALGRAVAANAPDRVLWGTDWPHVMYKDPRAPGDPPPRPADLLALLHAITGDDERLLRRILVENPERLYA